MNLASAALVLSTDRGTAGAGDPQPIRSGLRGRVSASETGPLNYRNTESGKEIEIRCSLTVG